MNRQSRGRSQDKQQLKQVEWSRSSLQPADQRGFTLIEFVLAITLIGIVGGMGSMFFSRGLNAFTAQGARADISNQGRLAVERMVREIRMARSRTVTDLPGCCSAATLSFVDVTGTTVTFAKSGNTITRNGTILAAGDAIALSFSYYQTDGVTAATTAAAVWSMGISLTVTKQGESQLYQVRVHPRNFV
ncbi:MAG: prepilin-type N-terminal cleavage/methylation domain-containing protein [Nitrospirae bacterium]|nr:prepilin-type N-terminal cleavage/methylation domain-containing protein [Candidatus Manganitrophaceae bacterium]